MIFSVAPLFCVTAATPRQTIGFDGVAPVQVGMTLDQAKRVLHGKFSIQLPEDDPNGCGFLSIKGPFGPVSYMFDRGRIRRADIDIFDPGGRKSAVKTAAGIGLGSSIADVRRAYGKRARFYPNAYDAPEPDAEIKSADGKSAIIFETSSGRVSYIRAGRLPWAEYIEGCS